MTRASRFVSGERVADLRPKLNRLVGIANADDTPRGSVGVPLVYPDQIMWMEILVLDPTTMQCVFPGDAANPSAEIWEVNPPPTFTELGRGAVSYVYTDINNRTADGTEEQQLTPVYLVGDLLAVANYELGEVWRDLNIDGRQWAAVAA